MLCVHHECECAGGEDYATLQGRETKNDIQLALKRRPMYIYIYIYMYIYIYIYIALLLNNRSIFRSFPIQQVKSLARCSKEELQSSMKSQLTHQQHRTRRKGSYTPCTEGNLQSAPTTQKWDSKTGLRQNDNDSNNTTNNNTINDNDNSKEY